MATVGVDAPLKQWGYLWCPKCGEILVLSESSQTTIHCENNPEHFRASLGVRKTEEE